MKGKLTPLAMVFTLAFATGTAWASNPSHEPHESDHAHHHGDDGHKNEHEHHHGDDGHKSEHEHHHLDGEDPADHHHHDGDNG